MRGSGAASSLSSSKDVSKKGERTLTWKTNSRPSTVVCIRSSYTPALFMSKSNFVNRLETSEANRLTSAKLAKSAWNECKREAGTFFWIRARVAAMRWGFLP